MSQRERDLGLIAMLSPSMPVPTWVKPARISKVIDGDTIDVEVDLGFQAIMRSRVRLMNVYAPEMTGPDHEQGVAARQFVIAWVNDAIEQANKVKQSWPLVIDTEQEDPRDKYGRYVATIWARCSDRNLNDDIRDYLHGDSGRGVVPPTAHPDVESSADALARAAAPPAVKPARHSQ